MRYIARNPIEAGVTRTADDWLWSSYTVLVGRMRRPPFLNPERLFAALGPPRATALARLRALIEDEVVAAA